MVLDGALLACNPAIAEETRIPEENFGALCFVPVVCDTWRVVREVTAIQDGGSRDSRP